MLKHVYYRLKQTKNDIGLIAIRNIRLNKNPFKRSFRTILNEDFVILNEDDIKGLNNELKELLKKLFDGKNYYVPYNGLNSINMFFYIKIDPINYNIKSYKTIKEIKKDEELIIDAINFNEFKITNNKQPVIENLKNTYCKIGRSLVQGVGVIVIKDIPINTNPFIITDNKCYNYNAIEVKKKDLEKINCKETIKMIKNFIAATNDDIFLIPYNGIDSINITFFLNHSNNNNLDVISDNCEYLGFISNKDIKAGEELFINYNHYKSNFNQIMS